VRVPVIYGSTVGLHDVEGLTMTEIAQIRRIVGRIRAADS